MLEAFFEPAAVAVVFCLLTAWGIARTSRRAEVKKDIEIGIFFAATRPWASSSSG